MRVSEVGGGHTDHKWEPYRCGTSLATLHLMLCPIVSLTCPTGQQYNVGVATRNSVCGNRSEMWPWQKGMGCGCGNKSGMWDVPVAVAHCPALATPLHFLDAITMTTTACTFGGKYRDPQSLYHVDLHHFLLSTR